MTDEQTEQEGQVQNVKKNNQENTKVQLKKI